VQVAEQFALRPANPPKRSDCFLLPPSIWLIVELQAQASVGENYCEINEATLSER